MSQNDITATVERLLESMKAIPGGLLPILHAVQDELGYVPEMSVPLIAETLNLSRAEVHGVISFYHYFRSSPQGHQVIQLCASESCQAVGGNALVDYLQGKLGVGFMKPLPMGSLPWSPCTA